jgi:1-hydroxycarotenoid 3,4-desaturase
VSKERVAIIGAGIAGLAAAVELATSGVEVIVLERAAQAGGKLRQVGVADMLVDSGPTVFTMRHVFDEIFAAAGASFADAVELRPLDVLARHAWTGTQRLDLFPDIDRSADAIGAFAGAAEARSYRQFCAQARRIHDTLDQSFIHASRPSMPELVRRIGSRRLGDLAGISPFQTMWRALEGHFADPRLRQLFGRYATYCGSSPFQAPATLMLVAHVEREGVWMIEGGMHRLAQALANLAVARGATIRCQADVADILVERGRARGIRLRSGERIEADAVVVNADVGALAAGLLGGEAARAAPAVPESARSLSAYTWSLVAETDGFPLAHHNVFFSDDYPAEFQAIRSGRPPDDPTVYVCAQDRGLSEDCHSSQDRASGIAPAGPERLFCIVNAPANGDRLPFDAQETNRCETRTFKRLERCGLSVRRRAESTVATSPADFERLFPGTGGALYGRASHGWMASFQRPGSRSRIPGLYLAGGSTHPGAGVPMAAISGRLAAASLVSDLASTTSSRRAVMRGGTSMR